jgi:hypothetical protein
MKLKKNLPDDIQCASLSVFDNKGHGIGLILTSGEFLPVDMVELTIYEMKQILVIMENFRLFYDNL